MRTIQSPSVPAEVPERYRVEMDRLLDAVLNGQGDSTPALRQHIAEQAGLLSRDVIPADASIPGELVPYVDKVALHAYRTTDGDVEALREAGYSEDAVFEITVSAALGAGLMRLECGLAALRGGK